MTVDIEHLERLEQAATPKPWRTSKPWDGHARLICDNKHMWEAMKPAADCGDDEHIPEWVDAELIVATRNALPELLADLRRERERNAELQRERDEAIAHDRQPYPTADAYDRVCEANEKKRLKVDELTQKLHDLEIAYSAQSGVVSQQTSNVDELIGRVRSLGRELQKSDTQNAELRTANADLQAEIVRHHKDFARWEEIADKGAARIEENEKLRTANAELVEALHSVRQVTECSNTSTFLDSIQRTVDEALRKHMATQHRDDCGLEGCTGFSCPYCARCTAECPNMRCARDEADESILPIDEGCDHFPQFRITTDDNT